MIHIAGKYENGLQYCTRCNIILTDYRNAMIPVGQESLAGWEEGSYIEVFKGNPTYSGITREIPDCVTVQ